MDYITLLGLIGMGSIAVSWIPQTLDVLRKKKVELELKFIVVYAIGSVLLLVYSFLISDIVFIILNSLTTLMAGINLFFALK